MINDTHEQGIFTDRNSGNAMYLAKITRISGDRGNPLFCAGACDDDRNYRYGLFPRSAGMSVIASTGGLSGAVKS